LAEAPDQHPGRGRGQQGGGKEGGGRGEVLPEEAEGQAAGQGRDPRRQVVDAVGGGPLGRRGEVADHRALRPLGGGETGGVEEEEEPDDHCAPARQSQGDEQDHPAPPPRRHHPPPAEAVREAPGGDRHRRLHRVRRRPQEGHHRQGHPAVARPQDEEGLGGGGEGESRRGHDHAAQAAVETAPTQPHRRGRRGCAGRARRLRHYRHSHHAILDPADPEGFANLTDLITIDQPGQPFIVQPGEFILGVTLEKIKIADDLVARVEGRSSLGRLGIIIHSTAGFVDAGFEGTITLEITNINRMPVALYPGMRVCQLAFETMSSPADVPYHMKKTSKYQGQELPQESMINNDPELVRHHRHLKTNHVQTKQIDLPQSISTTRQC